MAEFGNNNIETDGGEDIRAPFLSSSAAFPENGTITAAGVYIGFSGGGNMRGAIYSSAGDDPASAVLVADLGTKAMTGSAWNIWTGLSVAATAGVRYWLALKSSAEAYPRYQNSLPAADWTLQYRPITGENNSESDAWDDPIATLGTAASRGFSTYFTYTPAAAAYTITADPGSYSITGTAATLIQGYRGTADAGSIAITGQDASFDLVRLGESGSYEINGATAALLAGRRLSADAGGYSLTGQAASLTQGYEVAAVSGSIAITGAAASLKRGLLVTSVSGSYTITGVDASLEQGYLLTAAAGSYTLTGQASGLVPVFLTWPSPRNVLDVPHLNWFVELR